MTTYKVVLFTREKLGTPASLVSLDDKRKTLIERFSDYTNDLSIHQIEGSTMTYDEMKRFYDAKKTGLLNNDIFIFVDEKAYSSLPSSEIELVITHLRTLIVNEEVDVFYLANSMGNCNIVSKTTQATGDISQLIFYKEKSPNSVYAVASTVAKWDTIFNEMKKRPEKYATARLSRLITSEKFTAGTSWPRTFEPNINMVEDNVDTLYSYPCRYEQDFSKVSPNTENMSFYWFIFGVLIVVIGVWYLTKVSPTNRVIDLKIKEMKEK